MTLTERIRKQLHDYLIEHGQNIKQAYREMDASFHYETLLNFANRQTESRGRVLNTIVNFLESKGYQI